MLIICHLNIEKLHVRIFYFVFVSSETLLNRCNWFCWEYISWNINLLPTVYLLTSQFWIFHIIIIIVIIETFIFINKILASQIVKVEVFESETYLISKSKFILLSIKITKVMWADAWCLLRYMAEIFEGVSHADHFPAWSVHPWSLMNQAQISWAAICRLRPNNLVCSSCGFWLY